MSFKNVLEPTREKIIVDLLFAAVLVILALSIPSIGYQKQFLGMGLSGRIFSIMLSVLFGLVIYYPLACGIVFIYGRIAKKGEKHGSMDTAFAVLLVLLFNPVTYILIVTLIHILLIPGTVQVDQNVINRPCGIEVTGFAGNSPAKDAGMSVGEAVIKVDGWEIDTVDSFIHAVAGKKPGDYVSLVTDSKEYNIKTIENPDNPSSAFLGIIIKEKYCGK